VIPIQEWIEQKKNDSYSRISKKSRVITVLQYWSLPSHLFTQFSKNAGKFFASSDNQKLIHEAICEAFFSTSYKSFFRNCVQWILEAPDSFSNFKHQLRNWIQNELKCYLWEEPAYSKIIIVNRLLNDLKVANYFIQKFSDQDFPGLTQMIQDWLIRHALIKLIGVYLNKNENCRMLVQFEAIQLCNQLFSKLNQKQTLMNEVKLWVQEFFKVNGEYHSIHDLELQLKLVAYCIKAGEPFSSIAKECLSRPEIREILFQAVAEERLGNLGPEEHTLLYLYAFK